MKPVTARSIFSSTVILAGFATGAAYERFGLLGIQLGGVGTGGSAEKVNYHNILLTYFLTVGTGGSATSEYLAARGDWGYSFAGFESVHLVPKAIVDKAVPEKITRVREVLALAMTDLAKLLGVSRQATYDWQSGKTITPEHLSRLDDLLEAADVFALEGVRGDSRVIRRPIRRGKTLFQLFREGGSAAEAARSLVSMLRFESEQRAVLKRRLAGRKHQPSREIYKDFGVPTLNEGES